MANQTWKEVGKTFEDSKNALRLYVRATHGGMEHFSGGSDKPKFSPTTWGRVAILPNEGENVPDFMKRIGETEVYQNFVKQMGGTVAADADIRKHGVGMIANINSQSGMGINNPETILAELSKSLSELKKPLDPKIAKEIGSFFRENMSPEAREEARKAFSRTGGKSGVKIQH